MKKFVFAALAASFAWTGGAFAATLTSQSFDTNPTLSATQAPDTWYTDRYAPAGFTSQSFMGDNRLALELDAADGEGNRAAPFDGTFYSTQGRKFDTAGAQSFEIEMFIDSAWGPGRVGGLWGTGVDAFNSVTAYPILEYFDGQFNVFDYVNGGWIGIGTQTGFALDTFATLSVSLQPYYNDIEFYIDGELMASLDANGTTEFGNVIVQGYNNPAVDRTLYFDNFSASTAPISAVPLPAGLPLLAFGLAGLWGATRRKRV